MKYGPRDIGIKPWLKMWTEWLHDPKMLDLTLAEQGAWWRVVTLAQECGADGKLVKGSGVPLTLDEIATCVHITTAKDRRVFDSMLTKMHVQDSFHWDLKTLTITRFAERQAQAPSSTREAIKERVRLHREKQKQAVTENPLHPLTTPTTTKEGEQSRAEGNSYSNRKTVTAEAILAEIAKLHEENFSIMTPILSEKFKDFAENYHGPFEWIKDAFTEAVTNNVRKWAYVEVILDRWQQEGRKQHGTHRQGDKESSAKRLRQSVE